MNCSCSLVIYSIHQHASLSGVSLLSHFFVRTSDSQVSYTCLGSDSVAFSWKNIIMSFTKSDSHVYIQTILCVLLALIFSALFIRMELKIAQYEERLQSIAESKVNCCDKGENLHHF